jgi:antitoxin HicB
VSLPKWGEFCHTHGETYEEALENAKEVLTLLVEFSLSERKSRPEAKIFAKNLLAIVNFYSSIDNFLESL